MSQSESCCSNRRDGGLEPEAKDDLKYIKVGGCCGAVTKAGMLPRIGFNWSLSDRIGEIAARFGYKRMEYAISPGLYALGTPDENSPVLVSANYKLSFDVLRRDSKINAWVLVIDTKGINVWCAAGKGTFCDAEIIKRIKETKLEKIVKHKTIILPLLSAPGVAAHEIRKHTGFKAVFGPVEAYDIKKFIDNGMKNDAAMKTVEFPAMRRLEVAWLELSVSLDKAFWPFVIFVLVSGIEKTGYNFYAGAYRAFFYGGGVLTGIVSGSVIFSLLLPYLPGRYFSFKGGVLGTFTAALVLTAMNAASMPMYFIKIPAFLLLSAGVASFAAMNYTGATTFTSISGVKKEIKDSLPYIIACGALAAALMISEMIMRWL